MPQLLLIALIAIIAYLIVIISNVFNRSTKKQIMRSKDMQGTNYRVFYQDQDWLKTVNTSEHIIQSIDGLELHASFIKNTHPTNRCIILCHGYSADRKSMSIFARHYYDDYQAHICLIDARSHGLSEGNTIGFGYHDRKDIPLWINELKNYFGKETQFILHGVSMGASTLLYTALDGFDSSVKGIIVDSAFIDLKPIFIRQMKQIYHLPAFPFIYFVDLYMRFIVKIPLDKTQITKEKDKLTIPCLIIHGTLDRFVPYSMAETLNQIYPVYHEFLSVENAKHALGYAVNPDAYKASIKHFIQNIID